MRPQAVALLLLGVAAPQSLSPRAAPRSVEARQLSVVTSQSVLAAAPGARVSLFVDVAPKRNMHVYAPEQKGGYIRIELTLDRDRAFAAAKPLFPKPSNYYFAPLNETFKVFAAPFRIRQAITIAKETTQPIAITGTLRYQACDDEVCYRPEDVPVAWTIGLRPATAR